MKRIPLTQNQYALVDDEDYEDLSQFKWYALWCPNTRSYYAVRSIRLPNGKRTAEYMARRILGLERGDKREGDHINHVTRDNRRSNLRIVTHRQNIRNMHNVGYSWNKHAQKFHAQIGVNGVTKHLGYYDDPAEARDAYLAAKRIYHPTAPQSQRGAR